MAICLVLTRCAITIFFIRTLYTQAYPWLRRIALGVALDGLTWLLPHCVVWRLQLRRAHKLAITTIFAFGVLNIIIGGLRINGLTEVTYGGDVTYGIGTTLMWAIAQISTGIIVACSPHLRPVFEMIVPRRLTRVYIRKSASSQHITGGRHPSIVVTTRIDIRDSSPSPRVVSTFHDGHQEPWAPTFDVEPGPASELGHTMCDNGCLHRGSCCL
ncbi:hypothetical protein EK21DRAFT_96328 [Setomelanomma holmii]|uniref:Rhodopsin domain-containing protein n=1 Tax=Setomelanomma holmii TaxID=210430 RepID=A0A9P4LSG6_9PLEO|nr:hypothetical protein EK21DRAFT_96328 [Setomelanomma holmii]